MKNKCAVILKVQLLIGIVLMLCFSLHVAHTPSISGPIYQILLGILIVIFVLTLFQNKNHYIQLASQWLSILILPFAFNFLVFTGISALNLALPSLAGIFSIVGCILLLAVNIPWVIVDLPVVKNTILRLVVIAIINLSWIFNVNEFLDMPSFIRLIVYSGFMGGISMFILAFFIARAWGLKFSWNLKLVKTSNFQFWSLLLLLVLGIWYAFFNSNLYLTDTWQQLVCFWQWDFDVYHFTENALVSAARAGIFEETIRGLNLIVLLYAMRNFKGKIFSALIISAILFSLVHLTNLGGADGINYSAVRVLQQMTYTFGMGLVFGAVYLYTGKLWLSMLLHFFLDLLAMSASDSMLSMLDGWPAAVILLAISVVIAVWMLTGKRRKFMEDNVVRIVGK